MSGTLFCAASWEWVADSRWVVRDCQDALDFPDRSWPHTCTLTASSLLSTQMGHTHLTDGNPSFLVVDATRAPHFAELTLGSGQRCGKQLHVKALPATVHKTVGAGGAAEGAGAGDGGAEGAGETPR